jgi:hypothetical protein
MTSLWNTLTLTMSSQDGYGSPQYGIGNFTHDQAKAEIQGILDRLAREHPALATTAAETWRKGAKDDVVNVQPAPGSLIVFALYEYAQGEDPLHGALAWIDDFSRRGTGHDSQMIVPPTAPGGTFSA